MTFAQAVAAHRKALNLTQAELAPLLDCDGQTVSNWETGQTTPWPKRQVDVLLRLMRLCMPPGEVKAVAVWEQLYATVDGALIEPKGIKAGPDRCEEASLLSGATYLPCNQPAVSVVGWKGRTDAPIRMCEQCTWHNVKNRGGYVVSAFPVPAPARRTRIIDRI